MHDLPPRRSSDIAEAHLVVRKYLYRVYVRYDRCGNANDDKVWGEVDWIIHVDAACFCVSCFSPVFPSTFRRETQWCVTFQRTNRWGIRGCGICQHISNLSTLFPFQRDDTAVCSCVLLDTGVEAVDSMMIVPVFRCFLLWNAKST